MKDGVLLRQVINVINEIDFSEYMLDALLKYQYPNPNDDAFQDWNSKPFINTLRLIIKVNELCKAEKKKEKGISKTEFGIFALSLKSYDKIDEVAQKILDFRTDLEELADDTDKEIYIKNYINSYLAGFKNPEDNIKEYTDNMIRYLRLTKYIYIRGKYSNTYIDVEPRRMVEITSILENDDGKALSFNAATWRDYMGTYGKYELPFETVETLTVIADQIKNDVNKMETNLGLKNTIIEVKDTKELLKNQIDELRQYRTDLQNLQIKKDYHEDTSKIEKTIEALEDIRTHNKAKLSKKYSIELEKWSNVALNIIDDAVVIKPNSPVGDDNEPTYTAPSNVPDIECLYEEFGAIMEVTMLTNRDQWFNEGQPVMRHLREYEDAHSNLKNYCIFIAPALHTDTINTFFMSVKYEYQGKPQKIVPFTIVQLEIILETVKTVLDKGKTVKHTDMKELYDMCTDISSLSSSALWTEHISNELEVWKNKMTA